MSRGYQFTIRFKLRACVSSALIRLQSAFVPRANHSHTSLRYPCRRLYHGIASTLVLMRQQVRFFQVLVPLKPILTMGELMALST